MEKNSVQALPRKTKSEIETKTKQIRAHVLQKFGLMFSIQF